MMNGDIYNFSNGEMPLRIGLGSASSTTVSGMASISLAPICKTNCYYRDGRGNLLGAVV